MDEYHNSHNKDCYLLCPWLANSESLGGKLRVSFILSSMCLFPLITHSSDTLTAHLTLAIYRSGSLHTVVCSPSVHIVMLRMCVSSGGVWSVVVNTCRPGGGSVGSCRCVGQGTSVLYDLHSVHLKTVCPVGAGRIGLTTQC